LIMFLAYQTKGQWQLFGQEIDSFQQIRN
jgi:hypothetical protein